LSVERLALLRIIGIRHIVVPMLKNRQPILALLSNGLARGEIFNLLHAAAAQELIGRLHPTIVTRKK
jgi:hypothetical protein